jgi:signal transduction histidine kinase
MKKIIQIGFQSISHAAWWYITVISVALFIYSETKVFNGLRNICSEDCSDLFLLTTSEAISLQSYGISIEFYSGVLVVLLLIQFLAFFAAGSLLYAYGLRDRICLYTSILLIATGTILSISSPLLLESPRLQDLFRIESFVGELYLFFFFLFPDGRFRPRWLMIPAIIGLVGHIGVYFFPGWIIDPTTWPVWMRTGVWVSLHLLVIFSQVYRYRYAETVQLKRQILWFLISMAGFIVSVLALLIYSSFGDNGLLKLGMWFVYYMALLFMPFSIGIAILEHRQRHLSTLFNRTIVYSFVTIFVMGMYVLIVGSLGIVLNNQNNIFISLLATGIVAVLFQPLRVKIQQSVNRLVYGDREDPYKILSGLTERLELTMTNSSVLPSIVEEAAKALKLPFAAIDILVDGEYKRLASIGEDIHVKTEFPLKLQGESIGTFIVGARSLEETIPPEKIYLINDLLRQLTMAVHAVQISTELQRSRIKLVSLREEERRRLRRDLHDGLGASLSGISLQMDTLIYQNQVNTKERLLELQGNLRAAVGDIRQLVYNLRPPALDEFGLAFALKDIGYQFHNSPINISIHIPEKEDLNLHAAIEVAAYRIVQEGITNAVKHSNGSFCRVTVEPKDQHLSITIQDDGNGFPENRRKGVGLHSMRERAEEVDGTFLIKNDKGTVIQVKLPLWKEG